MWRLIPLLEASGNVQMAIDRWLLEQYLSGKHPPTLRFYTWSPPAISLGYHQRQYPEYWQHLTWQSQKLDLVRRPTGGRAVLHQGDLTYAVIASGLTGSRLQVYEKICEFLIQGWRSLGVELQYGTAGRGYIHNPNCFGTATGADLVTADGYKLIGSAQLRSAGAILQHGSMRLQPNAELFTQVFGTESFTNVQLPQSLSVEKIVAALIAAASNCFAMQIEVQPLSPSEWDEILALQP
ncbi:lipoate--protein ligase family protein [Nostocaceae cyanobacterium CENA369]|uniref:Lipoate--protein ligase family protein n=1 Tax=Dendronalium phyllosphericum CENA369 TaxID=1725256 RepID=A0A8J7I7Y8_9NOST|nr:biotin/lipoate A/B protein ligase family protein [Dendronalium phyllosphericum]MBH8574836.1 lipoate--protein ligase family protein [Dendronalium phyllosphericum CENA369]